MKKSEIISLDEFIDIITERKGDQIKKDLIELEKKKKVAELTKTLDLKPD